MTDPQLTALIDVIHQLNVYVFGFTLVTLAACVTVFWKWPLLGPWSKHMFTYYLAIKAFDFFGSYKGLKPSFDTPGDELFWQVRQLFARMIIWWGAGICLLLPTLKDLVGYSDKVRKVRTRLHVWLIRPILTKLGGISLNAKPESKNESPPLPKP